MATPRSPILGRAAGAALGLALLAGCGGEPPPGPNVVQSPSRLERSAGDGQTAAAGSTLPIRPAVRVTDQSGRAVPGVVVAFAVTAGGGSVTGGSATTDASGVAAVVGWTLGTSTGPNALRATLGALAPVDFTATAVAGPPAAIAVAAGNAQSAPGGTAVPVPPAARVADRFDNAVAGAGVQFAVTGGGGSVTGGNATTGADGIARVGSWTLGPTPGPNTLAAAITGIAGLQPVVITATAVLGPPATVTRSAGEGQTAAVGTALPVPPAVLVRDAAGNPIPNVAVAFAVTGGGGSVTGANATTGADGIAAVGGWTLGSSPGPNTLGATVAGSGIAGNPIGFTATAVAGPAASLTREAGDNQSAPAGTPVPIAPTVRVRDAAGNPVANVAVTFDVIVGGGTITGANATTDAAGLAAVGSWTLGTTVGPNQLRATVTGLDPVVFSATGRPGPAATMTKVAGDGQTAAPGTAVPVRPAVRLVDAFGNPVPGVTVTFAVASGGGSVTGATPLTGPDGVATVGGWTLGPAQGQNSLTATAPGAGIAGNPATFTATATVAAPASISLLEGDGQTAFVGTAVATAPAVVVRNAGGSPVAGVTVTFAVTAGGGGVSGATRTTDAAGIARVGAWTLGTTPGGNGLRATATGSGIAGNPVSFGATAEPGPPSSITLYEGNNQTTAAGGSVLIQPAVLVRDPFGNLVPGADVVFTVASGGGSVSGGEVVTDAAGEARVGRWTLGATPGPNALNATAGGAGISGNPVTFAATGIAPAYQIALRYLSALTPSQQQAFVDAAARWQQLVVGDLSDVFLVAPAGTCGPASPSVPETIDDLLIFVTVTNIDGPGGILGQAGPCYVRSTSRHPVLGFMRFDAADLATLEGQNLLRPVILHEMGHVMGIGTIWTDLGLLNGAGGPDPFFNGRLARDAFVVVGGEDAYGGTPVPVENTGGSGTRDSHWRESVFANELMTGFIDPGANPLSRVTVASLADEAYVVTLDPSDPYTVPAAGIAAAGPRPGSLRLVRDVLDLPLYAVDPSGRVTPLPR